MFLPKIRRIINTTAGVVLTVFFLSSLISSALLVNNSTRGYILKSLAYVDPGTGGTIVEEEEKQKEKATKSKDLSKLLINMNMPQPPGNSAYPNGNKPPIKNNQSGLLQNMTIAQPPYNRDTPPSSASEGSNEKIQQLLNQLIESVPNSSNPTSAERCSSSIDTSACFCTASNCYWNDANGHLWQISKTTKSILTPILSLLELAGAVYSKYGKIYIDTNNDGVADTLATKENLIINPNPLLESINISLNTTNSTQASPTSSTPTTTTISQMIAASSIPTASSSTNRTNITIPLSHIAAIVFAESSNGTDPVEIQTLITWVILNRAASTNVSPYTQALGPMLNSILGNWSSLSLKEATEQAITNCLQDAGNCPSQNSRFLQTLNIVKDIYSQFIRGATDPTGGSLFFSKQSKLQRSGVNFGSSTELMVWLAQQAQNYSQENSNFSYVISQPFAQNAWSNTKVIQSTGSDSILYACNNPCCTDASCR